MEQEKGVEGDDFADLDDFGVDFDDFGPPASNSGANLALERSLKRQCSGQATALEPKVPGTIPENAKGTEIDENGRVRESLGQNPSSLVDSGAITTPEGSL